jgi:SAM-dependent methyltransferase
VEIPKAVRLFTLYLGVAFLGDKLVRPSIVARKARAVAGPLDLPVLNIGHRLTSSPARRMFQAPGLWGDINVDIDARAAAADDRLIYADPTALPFEDDSFGAVILLHIVEKHDQPLALAEEADRVVAPGGTIFAVTPPWWTPHAWFNNKWLLVDTPTGGKRAFRLWQRKKPRLADAFTEPSADPESPDLNAAAAAAV